MHGSVRDGGKKKKSEGRERVGVGGWVWWERKMMEKRNCQCEGKREPCRNTGCH